MAVDTALVRQYSDNILLLSQQLLPKLKATVYLKADAKGEMEFQDQLASEEAQEKIARNEQVVNSDPNYARRKITPRYFYKAPLLDSWDKVQLVKDPTNEIVQNNAGALARAQDNVIAAAFFATAYGGKEGTTTYTLPSGNIIANGGAGLTVAKLLSAKQILDKGEVPAGDRTCSVTSKQLQDLLAITQITSADYNSVRALVEGQIDTFLGFKFVLSERMPVASSIRKCAAYHRTGMVLGTWIDLKTSIDELPGKHFSWQIYAGQSYGATRLEEAKVVEIDCLES